MSEKIKIAIVINDEKLNAVKKGSDAPSLILTQDASVTLMPVLLKNHLMTGSFCGQRGDCGRCIVQFVKGAPLPTGVERARLSPEELRQGYRLACVTRPRADCIIKIVGGNDVETPVVTELNLPSESIDLSGHEILQSQNQKSDAMKFSEKRSEDSLKDKRYIIAVDLGTTTVAMQLRDMETGETVDTYCENNPQRRYGTDVLSRIEASCNGSGEELRKLICQSLARGLRQFAGFLRKQRTQDRQRTKNLGQWTENLARRTENLARRTENAGSRDARLLDDEAAGARIIGMCIAGNTTMEHLLLGYDVKGLGKAPFVPVETDLQVISLDGLFSDGQAFGGDRQMVYGDRESFAGNFPVYIAPCISAFVGGDIVAGLYALHMLPAFFRQEPEGERMSEGAQSAEGKAQAMLLIDLGTNGEMAITDGKRMIVTATAAGPAFEGNGDLIGTDRIALTASLMGQGVLDETGLLAEPYFEKGVRIAAGREQDVAGDMPKSANAERNIENECYFRQEDIRALQMAKAAIRAGVEILWEEMGRPEVEQVYLAGGFGYYLDVEAAFTIGLLPSYMRGKVRAVGNTSLAGAFMMGRDLCAGSADGESLGKMAISASKVVLGRIESINLAEREGFEKLYLRYMNLEEN